MKHNTQKAISSLEYALEQSIRSARSPDEFTVRDYSERKGIGLTKARREIYEMVSAGLLQKRSLAIDGTLKDAFCMTKKEC